VLSDKWYNVELKAHQNIFVAKFGLEKENISSKYNIAPLVLKAEDTYLVSGAVGF